MTCRYVEKICCLVFRVKIFLRNLQFRRNTVSHSIPTLAAFIERSFVENGCVGHIQMIIILFNLNWLSNDICLYRTLFFRIEIFSLHHDSPFHFSFERQRLTKSCTRVLVSSFIPMTSTPSLDYNHSNPVPPLFIDPLQNEGVKCKIFLHRKIPPEASEECHWWTAWESDLTHCPRRINWSLRSSGIWFVLENGIANPLIFSSNAVDYWLYCLEGQFLIPTSAKLWRSLLYNYLFTVT